MLEYYNHAGRHLVEYLYEKEDGLYSTMYGKWNGFDNVVEHRVFRFNGHIQSGWNIFNTLKK